MTIHPTPYADDAATASLILSVVTVDGPMWHLPLDEAQHDVLSFTLQDDGGGIEGIRALWLCPDRWVTGTHPSSITPVSLSWREFVELLAAYRVFGDYEGPLYRYEPRFDYHLMLINAGLLRAAAYTLSKGGEVFSAQC